MLEPAEVAALLAARHADPFAVLGLHAAASGQLWLRALLPGAAKVAALHAASGRLIVELIEVDPAGFFEARVPLLDKHFDYRLRIDWHAGGQSVLADAYAFWTQIPSSVLVEFARGELASPHEWLGAHPIEINGVAGVRFAVWAPNARRVSVVGNFNQWDGRRHVLRRRHEVGIWEMFVPHVAPGDLYKFEVVGAAGDLLPLKCDPYAFATELRPENASRVAQLPALRALPPGRAAANQRHAPISIYEVHLASWRRFGDADFPSWDELAGSLPGYARSLGFTHVELLPISEYPFDGSWGYQPLGMFAPSARFGDAAGFTRFVEACHAHGIGVLLDWVPAHFPADAHGLAQFDGTALYEYADPREGFHNDWNTLIYNFRRTEVRAFLAASARYWIERFAVDGLRVDAVASMLYRDYSREQGEWLPNHEGGRENLEAISLLRELNLSIGLALPGAVTIAEESTAFPLVSAPTCAGGLGFHYKWNMGWMNDTLRYIAEEPIHRRWHHDKLSFGLVYAFSENYVLPISHDEVVHGKRSMLGKMPGDDWQRFANLRAYYGFMWGHPGKKLLFMGQEFAQPGEWQHQQPLPWELLEDPRHRGVQQLIGDLNRLYVAVPALHRLDCEAAGFQWLVGEDREHSVFAWARFDGHGGMGIVICNFTPVPRAGYRLPVPPGADAWREVLNTDSAHYGGTDFGNDGRALIVAKAALRVNLPPLATVFLVPA